MFEVGFSEILLILIIALVVIGPERLPEVARGLGNMIGKVKRFVENVRSETDLQGELADLRRQLDLSKEAAQLQNLGESLRNDIQSSVDEVDYSLYNRPSTEEIQRQHREAEAHNAAQNAPMSTHEHDDEPDLATIQRPTFGRDQYEALPEDYHQQGAGVMLSKAPAIPEAPVAPIVPETPSVTTESQAKPA